MKNIDIPTIPSDTSNSLEKSIEIAEKIGYPVVIRPAFTLGGEGGVIVYSKEELINIASNGINVSPIHQVLIEKYIFGYEEFEFEVNMIAMEILLQYAVWKMLIPLGCIRVIL